jgi:hypothetical protein
MSLANESLRFDDFDVAGIARGCVLPSFGGFLLNHTAGIALHYISL